MIYLVRHGQTAWNAEGRFQGHGDSPLTELGRRQARAYGDLLKDLIRDADGWRLVASPLGRCQATADAIAERLGLAVETDRRLIEVSLGQWDGRLRSDLRAEFPEAFAQTGWAFQAPAGETYEASCARAEDWLTSLPPEPRRKVIAVAHGISGRLIRGVYAGLSREDTVNQEVPQDAIFRLADGNIHRLECG